MIVLPSSLPHSWVCSHHLIQCIQRALGIIIVQYYVWFFVWTVWNPSILVHTAEQYDSISFFENIENESQILLMTKKSFIDLSGSFWLKLKWNSPLFFLIVPIRLSFFDSRCLASGADVKKLSIVTFLPDPLTTILGRHAPLNSCREVHPRVYRPRLAYSKRNLYWSRKVPTIWCRTSQV